MVWCVLDNFQGDVCVVSACGDARACVCVCRKGAGYVSGNGCCSCQVKYYVTQGRILKHYGIPGTQI